MKNIVKVILGVAVVGIIVGGCFMFFNKLKSNSIFIVITSQGKELDENALTDYMSAVKF